MTQSETATITLGDVVRKLAAAGDRMGKKNPHKLLMRQAVEVLVQLGNRLTFAEVRVKQLEADAKTVVLTDA